MELITHKIKIPKTYKRPRKFKKQFKKFIGGAKVSVTPAALYTGEKRNRKDELKHALRMLEYSFMQQKFKLKSYKGMREIFNA